MSQDSVDKYTNVVEEKHNAVLYNSIFILQMNLHMHACMYTLSSSSCACFCWQKRRYHFTKDWQMIKQYSTCMNTCLQNFKRIKKSHPSQTFLAPALPLVASFGADWLVLHGQPSWPGMTGCY